jgi:iron complex transport system substrate-binding protein
VIGVFLLSFACVSRETPLNQQVTTRIINDGLGRKVEIPSAIERVVSLAPNLTEIVFAVGAGSKLVGVTEQCNYPEEALAIRKIGDTINPNLESIIAARPQVVLVTTASQNENFARTLEQNQISFVATDPKDIASTYESILLIGNLLGEEKNAAKLVDEMRGRIERVKEKLGDAEPVSVFLQIDKESLYTIGRDSFLTEVIAISGGKSVTAEIETAYPKISKERALLLQPEVIMIPDKGEGIQPNFVFHESPAVINGRVFRIDADVISRPGPRIADAVEKIARLLHPEKFR